MSVAHDVEQSPALPVPGLVRSPSSQWLLALVSLGVYLVVHHWTINRELRDFGVEVDPLKAALAVFPGGVLVVPYLLTAHRTGTRIAVAQETVGLTPSIRPALGTVASPFAALHIPYLQTELNRVWQADDGDGANHQGVTS